MKKDAVDAGNRFMSNKKWNPFELIQVPHTIPIDPATLKTTYFEVQKKLHPDRPQKEELPFTSADANEAYQQLKHPGTSAKALLDLKGLSLDLSHQPHALLETLMAWEEKLSSTSEEEQETLCSQIQDQQQKRCAAFMELYKKEALTEQENEMLNTYALALQYYDRLLTRYQ